MQPIIEVKNVSKKYRIGEQTGGYRTLRDSLFRRQSNKEKNEIWALKDVSFDVYPGDTIGIIGKNGAGKSTLLKILSRITPPAEGKVICRGRVASLLEVGTGFHAELTGRENIYLNGSILGLKKAEIDKKFDEIVDFAGVEKFLDTPLKHYSSGMQLRLAFAVAAHLEPEILIIDEVLAVGDAEFQKKCLGKMEDISKGEGRTILFVSHNMGAVNRLCNKALLLENGNIIKISDNVNCVISSYLNENNIFDSIWINEENKKYDIFIPLKIYLTYSDLKSESKNDGDFFNCKRGEKILLNIEGILEKHDSRLHIGFILYNENNEVLYMSYHVDGSYEDWPTLNIGDNHIIAEIETNYLNEGVYSIEFISGLHYTKWIIPPMSDEIKIYFKVNGNFNNSPFWFAKRTGYLAPLIKWKVK